MVRLKHRYLLVNIVYPPTGTDGAKPLSQQEGAASDAETQFHLQVHRPTPDAFTPKLLAQMIKTTVGEMFGDWGMGRLGGASAGSVSGSFFSDSHTFCVLISFEPCVTSVPRILMQRVHLWNC